MKRRWLFPFSLALLVAASCSGGGDETSATQSSSPNTTVTTTPPTTAASTTTSSTATTSLIGSAEVALEDGWDVVRDWAEAYGREDFRDMASLSTGPAQLYVEYVQALTRTSRLLGRGISTTLGQRPEGAIEIADDEFRLVGSFMELDQSEGTGPTSDFEDFVVAFEGGVWRISSFTRNGYTLDTLVFAPGEETAVEVNSVRGWISYGFAVPVSDGSVSLFIVVSIDNLRSASVGLPSGAPLLSFETRRQFQEALIEGPFEIHPNSIAEAVIVWSDMETDELASGGQAIVGLLDSETFDRWELELAIPPLTQRPIGG